MTSTRSSSENRWIARLIVGVLILIWALGLQDAILGGTTPGYVRYLPGRPYPVRAVIVTCGIISAELALLLAILRPTGISRKRVFIALAVFGPLWFADYSLVSGWTDQAGYCYSNGRFLGLIVAFLIVSLLVFGTREPSAWRRNQR